MTAAPALGALRIDDPPEPWVALGFAVREAQFTVGGVRVELGGDGGGITGWTLAEAAAAADAVHPNGVIAIDHVVLVSGDFDASAARLEREGIALRRMREVAAAEGRAAFRQGFRRLGPAILELVEADGPERFWGLTFTAGDLDALAARLGERLGPVRPAVQPGRRIATLRRSAGVSPAVAFMDPER